jgi:mono/diheme cytochrome c family protein
VIGHPCTQCHAAFDPTNPPKDPNDPKWENIMGLIGNQYVNQPLAAFLAGLPDDHFARQIVKGARPGTVDTSLNPNDFMNNPGTQNNITDFLNRPIFVERMKDPYTGEVRDGRTQHVLKGGEDSVGDHLSLIRVFVNIGMCTEECWVPKFPVPGAYFGSQSHQRPFSIPECSRDCEAWNYADAKMTDLAAFLITGGPTYLTSATDVDGTPGSKLVDLAKVPRGRVVFARECAVCHSSKAPPELLRHDKDALEKFYEGHVFGREDTWQDEFPASVWSALDFQKKFLVRDPATGKLRPKQFAEDGMFGQDWLGNDEVVPFGIIGTNRCRAMHDNHNAGHIWEQFASETYRARPSPGSVPVVVNRLLPAVGGAEWGEKKVEGGPGYLRNVSLLSLWAIAPFLHNNAIGPLVRLADGSIDYTVQGRVKMYEAAMEELLTSDDQAVEAHREPKITVADHDFRIATREDGQGLVRLTVKKGTPVAYFGSTDPHAPVFSKCEDLVENKGHQFGIALPPADKKALVEFLKLM